MVIALDAIVLYMFLVPRPPVLHFHFSLETGEDERDGNLFVTETFTEQSVVALRSRRYSASAHAEQQKVDAPSSGELTDEFVRLFDSFQVAIDSHLGFLEADGIKYSEIHVIKGDIVTLVLHRAAVDVR